MEEEGEKVLAKCKSCKFAATPVPNKTGKSYFHSGNVMQHLKGGESSSQFRWFTIAKIELYFLMFFVLILGQRLYKDIQQIQKDVPPKKVFGNAEF